MKTDMDQVAQITADLVGAAMQNPALILAINYAASNLLARAAHLDKGPKLKALKQGVQNFGDHTRLLFKMMEAGGLDQTAHIPPTKKH